MNQMLNDQKSHTGKNIGKVLDSNNHILKKNPKNIEEEKSIDVSSEKKLTHPVFLNDKYYLSREMALIVDKYGKSIFNLNKEYEAKFLIPSTFLCRHLLTPETREKMVDWMIEVFSVNKSEPGTLELAVHIMDAYILNTKKTLEDSDIHLIGLASIYISSKIEEKIPLRLTHVVNNLGKNTFTKDEIIEMEKDIVKTIEFDFFTAGNYDYLMIFFYDLKVNNSKIINKYEGKDIVDKYMNFCVFLSKLILYSHEFVTYRTSLVSLAILSFAFDFMKENDLIKNINLQHLFRDWIYYLVNEMKFDPGAVGYVYQKIYELYKLDIAEPQKAYEESNGDYYDEVSNLFRLYHENLF